MPRDRPQSPRIPRSFQWAHFAIFGALGLLALLSVAGCDRGFGADVTIDRGCVHEAIRLEITVTFAPAGTTITQTVSDGNAFFAAGHQIVIVPPDGATSIGVVVIARGLGGEELGRGATDIPIDGHQLVGAALALGNCGGDGPAVDLAGGDRGSDDLAVDDAAPDLLAPDLPLDEGAIDLAVTRDFSINSDFYNSSDFAKNYDFAQSHDLYISPDLSIPDLATPDLALPPDLSFPDLTRPCGGDVDCSGLTPRCDLATGRCVACLPQNDNCPIGSFCAKNNGQFQCSAGCKSAQDCKASPGATFACCNNLCVNVANDRDNCGGCQRVCANSQSCCGGNCADTSADPANCGGCGTVCALPNASAVCSGGSCKISACDNGYQNCNFMDFDGCETNVLSNAGACGGCGKVCSSNHINPACANGVCSGACVKGFGDCNGNKLVDGCEAALITDPANCGSCGQVCAPIQNGVVACGGGACTVGSCTAGFGDCNQIEIDGCEVDLRSTAADCGQCGVQCLSKRCVDGDCVRRIFASSALFTGNLGGLAGADQNCQHLAEAASLGGVFKAWLSDHTTSAAQRLVHGKADYVLTDGTVVASNWTGLTSGQLLHAIDKTEKKSGPPTGTSGCGNEVVTAYTATNFDGNADAANDHDCSAWTTTGAGSVVWGHVGATDRTWTDWCAGGGCASLSVLYCIEQ